MQCITLQCMDAQIVLRIDTKDRDAIQRIADHYRWSFSQAARVLLREGLNASTEWNGDEVAVTLADDAGERDGDS
jgi:hypothetical protein